MNTSFKTLKTELIKVKKRIKDVDFILFANPVQKIINLRKQVQEILEKYGNQYSKIAVLVEPLAKKEKFWFDLAKKQNGMKLINRKSKLGMEKHQLLNSIWILEPKHIGTSL